MHLKLARVVAIHPESQAIDVTIMDDGRRISGVQVSTGSAGTDFGSADLNIPDAKEGYKSGNTKTRDIYAVLAWVGDVPIALGFLFPQIAECLFAEKGRKVYRHGSDVYFTIDANGNTELFHPSGAYLRIGTSGSHEDLTGKDYDKVWKIKKNTDKAVNIHIAQAGGKASVNIDPVGNIAIASAGTLVANIQGDSTITTPTLTLNGDYVVNGKITASGDISGNGISLDNHTHPDPQGGNTSKPS